ncbi:MAG TPA: hypothetical protein VFH45_03070, partial [Acidimicrobiales bacterium]|nr:hypothetical protein [Acidimicrobiales bacterium]
MPANASKFTPPRLPGGHVARPRLTRALDAACQQPVTWLVGPPGSGKTVLLAEWAAGRATDGVCWWASLDAGDRRPDLFWASILRSLSPVGPAVGDAGAPSPSAEPGRCPPEVARRLAELPSGVVVLDNFDRACTDEVVAAAAHLVEALPRHVRLVVASRRRHRLDVRQPHRLGAWAELGGRDLAFTCDEAARLIEALTGRHVARADVRALVE